MLLLSLISFVVSTSLFAMKTKELVCKKSNQKITVEAFDDNTAIVRFMSGSGKTVSVSLKKKVKKLFLNKDGFGPALFLYEDGTGEFFIISNYKVVPTTCFNGEKIENVFFASSNEKFSLWLVVLSDNTSVIFGFSNYKNGELKNVKKISPVTGKIKNVHFYSKGQSIRALAVFCNGTTSLYFFSAVRMVLRRDLSLKKEVENCLFSPAGRYLFVRYNDETCALISVRGKRVLEQFKQKAVQVLFGKKDRYLFVAFDNDRCSLHTLGPNSQERVSFEEKSKCIGLSGQSFIFLKFEDNVFRICDLNARKAKALIFEGQVKSLHVPKYSSEFCLLDTENRVIARAHRVIARAQGFGASVHFEKRFDKPVRFVRIFKPLFNQACFVVVVFEDNAIEIFDIKSEENHLIDKFTEEQNKIVDVNHIRRNLVERENMLELVFEDDTCQEVPFKSFAPLPPDEQGISSGLLFLKKRMESQKSQQLQAAERQQQIQFLRQRQQRAKRQQQLQYQQQLEQKKQNQLQPGLVFSPQRPMPPRLPQARPLKGPPVIPVPDGFLLIGRPLQRATLTFDEDAGDQEREANRNLGVNSNFTGVNRSQNMRGLFMRSLYSQQMRPCRQALLPFLPASSQVVDLISDDDHSPNSPKEKNKKPEIVDLTSDDDDSVLKKRKRGREKNEERTNKRQKTE